MNSDEMPKSNGNLDELKSSLELAEERFENERQEVEGGENAERVKIIDKFDEALDEINNDIKESNVGRYIRAGGFSNDEEKLGRIADYGLSPRPRINGDPGGIYNGLLVDKERTGEILKKANAFVSIMPAKVIDVNYKEKKAGGIGGLIGKKDLVKTEIERDATNEDLCSRCGYNRETFGKNNDLKERIFHTIFAYQNSFHGHDEWSEKNSTTLSISAVALYLGESSVKKIIDGLRAEPENFWKIVEAIGPNILTKKPPREESFYGGSGLLIKEEGAQDEIINWPVKIEAVAPVETAPVLPPDFPPSSEIITSKRWSEEFSGLPPVQVETLIRLQDIFNISIELGKTAGFSTKYGMINGPLLWVDSELKIAIFDTPQGKIKIPLNEIIGPSSARKRERTLRREDSAPNFKSAQR